MFKFLKRKSKKLKLSREVYDKIMKLYQDDNADFKLLLDIENQHDLDFNKFIENIIDLYIKDWKGLFLHKRTSEVKE